MLQLDERFTRWERGGLEEELIFFGLLRRERRNGEERWLRGGAQTKGSLWILFCRIYCLCLLGTRFEMTSDAVSFESAVETKKLSILSLLSLGLRIVFSLGFTLTTSPCFSTCLGMGSSTTTSLPRSTTGTILINLGSLTCLCSRCTLSSSTFERMWLSCSLLAWRTGLRMSRSSLFLLIKQGMLGGSR